MSTCCQMISQHIGLYAPDGRNRRACLMDHIQAGPLISDHLLEPADLAFDATQSRQLPAVIGQWLRSSSSLFTAHVLETVGVYFSIHTTERQGAYLRFAINGGYQCSE